MLKRLWLVLSIGWAACVLIPEAFATYPPGWPTPSPVRLLITAGMPLMALLLWPVARFVATGRWTVPPREAASPVVRHSQPFSIVGRR